MFFGMWLVWILGGLGVLFFGGLLGIGNWAYFFLATGLLAGASAAVNQILERLKELDEVAYVRFASVYREFKDVNTFMEELGKLLKK